MYTTILGRRGGDSLPRCTVPRYPPKNQSDFSAPKTKQSRGVLKKKKMKRTE